MTLRSAFPDSTQSRSRELSIRELISGVDARRLTIVLTQEVLSASPSRCRPRSPPQRWRRLSWGASAPASRLASAGVRPERRRCQPHAARGTLFLPPTAGDAADVPRSAERGQGERAHAVLVAAAVSPRPCSRAEAPRPPRQSTMFNVLTKCNIPAGALRAHGAVAADSTAVGASSSVSLSPSCRWLAHAAALSACDRELSVLHD